MRGLNIRRYTHKKKRKLSSLDFVDTELFSFYFPYSGNVREDHASVALNVAHGDNQAPPDSSALPKCGPFLVDGINAMSGFSFIIRVWLH